MRSSANIVVLTGSGISAESGLSTFRENGGLWDQHRVEDVATPEAFARDPNLVQRFYNARRARLNEVGPNEAHYALARLEQHQNDTGRGSLLIVTQNVDNLHETAGSKNVLHMHGELRKVRCRACGSVITWLQDVEQSTPCPTCGQAPALRPHIVWFGEMPFHLNEIDNALQHADLFVSIGTSGNVYPAAGFVSMVRAIGRAHTLELNLQPSETHSQFAEARHGPATDVVANWVNEITKTEELS